VEAELIIRVTISGEDGDLLERVPSTLDIRADLFPEPEGGRDYIPVDNFKMSYWPRYLNVSSPVVRIKRSRGKENLSNLPPKGPPYCGNR
jgi:hypothetical protein